MQSRSAYLDSGAVFSPTEAAVAAAGPHQGSSEGGAPRCGGLAGAQQHGGVAEGEAEGPIRKQWQGGVPPDRENTQGALPEQAASTAGEAGGHNGPTSSGRSSRKPKLAKASQS